MLFRRLREWLGHSGGFVSRFENEGSDPLSSVVARTVTIEELILHATFLRSEHGENPEYDRALVELVIDAAGVSMDMRPEFARLIGIISPVF
jgi:hypothetical protein